MNIKDGASGYPMGNRDPRRRGRGVNARNIKRGNRRRPGCLPVILLVAVLTTALATVRDWSTVTAHLGSVYPTTMCAQEDGSGDAQAYPCLWDARVQGNGTWGQDYPPVLVYVRGTCPSLPPVARCFEVDGWLVP